MATNETLERQIKNGAAEVSGDGSKSIPLVGGDELVKLLENERKTNAKLLSENNQLKEKLHRVKVNQRQAVLM